MAAITTVRETRTRALEATVEATTIRNLVARNAWSAVRGTAEPLSSLIGRALDRSSAETSITGASGTEAAAGSTEAAVPAAIGSLLRGGVGSGLPLLRGSFLLWSLVRNRWETEGLSGSLWLTVDSPLHLSRVARSVRVTGLCWAACISWTSWMVGVEGSLRSIGVARTIGCSGMTGLVRTIGVGGSFRTSGMGGLVWIIGVGRSIRTSGMSGLVG